MLVVGSVAGRRKQNQKTSLNKSDYFRYFENVYGMCMSLALVKNDSGVILASCEFSVNKVRVK